MLVLYFYIYIVTNTFTICCCAQFSGKLSYSVKGESTNRGEKEDLELPLFDFITISEATNEFSENNKLGEGGFGPVYVVMILIHFRSMSYIRVFY